MTRRAGKLPLTATVTVSFWTAGLALAYLLELGSGRELLWACSGVSLILLPIVIVDSRRTGEFSWLVVVGLLLPVINLLTSTVYSLTQFRRRHGKHDNHHGLFFFVGVFTASLAVVITPYVLGPVSLACGVLIRRQYSTREGALLLTAGGVATLFGLALNIVLFVFIRPGPVL